MQLVLKLLDALPNDYCKRLLLIEQMLLHSLAVSLLVLPPLALLLVRQGKFHVRFIIVLRLEKLYLYLQKLFLELVQLFSI